MADLRPLRGSGRRAVRGERRRRRGDPDGARRRPPRAPRAGGAGPEGQPRLQFSLVFRGTARAGAAAGAPTASTTTTWATSTCSSCPIGPMPKEACATRRPSPDARRSRRPLHPSVDAEILGDNEAQPLVEPGRPVVRPRRGCSRSRPAAAASCSSPAISPPPMPTAAELRQQRDVDDPQVAGPAVDVQPAGGSTVDLDHVEGAAAGWLGGTRCPGRRTASRTNASRCPGAHSTWSSSSARVEA